MAALTVNIVYRGRLGEGLNYLVAEAKSATAADTWTVSEWTAVKDCYGFSLKDGAGYTCTEATNVVTVPAGPSTEPMVLIATGY